MSSGLIGELSRRLQVTEPSILDGRSASVAVILSPGAEASTLLIKRSERAGDPWSGQIAFPGGKSQEGDQTMRGTAVREAREEVGIDLDRHGHFLGYSSPVRTHTGTMIVVPSIFGLTEEVPVKPNSEVQSFRWISVGRFVHGRSDSAYTLQRGGLAEKLPAYEVEGYVVWGLTYRIASALFAAGAGIQPST